MHCPGCGNESSLDQKFCRTCGFNLEPVTKLVINSEDSAVSELDESEREKLLVRRMFRVMGWGLIAVLIGVFLLVVNKTFMQAQLFQLLAAVFLLGGTGLATYSIFEAMKNKLALPGKTSPSQARNQIRQAPITSELPGEHVLAPASVTERTTQLIAAGKIEPKE